MCTWTMYEHGLKANAQIKLLKYSRYLIWKIKVKLYI